MPDLLSNLLIYQQLSLIVTAPNWLCFARLTEPGPQKSSHTPALSGIPSGATELALFQLLPAMCDSSHNSWHGRNLPFSLSVPKLALFRAPGVGELGLFCAIPS